MRILVIGGTRFIGLATVQELAAADHDVAVFHRGTTAADLPEGVVQLQGNRAELPEHREALLAFQPDVVLDMIAFTEQDAREAVKVFDGEVGKLVVISSCDVYRAYGVLLGQEDGFIQPVPLAEDAELRPRLYPFRGETLRAADDPQQWMDDYDKILVERTALAAPRMRTVALRLPMVYGPRDGQHRLFPYLKRMDDSRPAILLSSLDAQRRFARGYVDNVAHAIALACTTREAHGVYNVADEPTLSELEWVEALAKAVGWRGSIVVKESAALPDSLRGGPETAQDLAVSTQRIRSDLAFAESVSMHDALARTIAWERDNPPGRFDPARFDYAAEDEVLMG